MKGSTIKGSTITVLLIFYTAIVWLVSLWTDRNLDFWVSQIKGEVVDVPMWLSFIVTFIGNGFIIAANILAEIAKFAV